MHTSFYQDYWNTLVCHVFLVANVHLLANKANSNQSGTGGSRTMAQKRELYRCDWPITKGRAKIVSKCGPDHGFMLAQKFKSKTEAKRAIVCACGASSVPAFRSRLLGCKHPELTCFTNNTRNHLEKNIKDEKQVARRTARELHLGPRSFSNPSCIEHENGTHFRHCPCKNAYYCCKSCQVAHWRVHRKACSYHLESKKKKSGKKKAQEQ